MVPLKLTIEGFYSYQEAQTIDFTALTEAGLFGIFGTVGSGKSSILEAISYVLYGVTERLDASDRRAYNMLNLKSEKALIDFEFRTGADSRYRFTASWKRKKKDYSATSSVERSAYRWENEAWIPLEQVNAEQILGLKYDNFKRTIIIPQGKFKEFLELTKGDRVKMLKEIFNLYQYDFAEPVKRLTARNNEALYRNTGVLSQYQLYTDEGLNERSAQLEDRRGRQEQLRLEAMQARDVFEKLQQIKERQERMEQARMTWEELQRQQSDFDRRAERIRRYDKALVHFKSILGQQQLYRQRLEEAQSREAGAATEEARCTAEWTRQQEVLEQVSRDYAQLDHWKQQILAIRHVQDYRTAAQTYTQLEERGRKGQEHVVQAQHRQEALEQQLRDTEDSLKIHKQDKPDMDLLLQATEWYNRQEQLLAEQTQSLQQRAQCIRAIQEQQQYFAHWAITPEERNDFFAQKTAAQQSLLDAAVTALQQLQVQAELQRYRSTLVPGQACPLCGATAHHITDQHIPQDWQELLTAAHARVQEHTESLQEWRDHYAESGRRAGILQEWQDQEQELTRTAGQLQEALAQHHSAFAWTDLLHPDQKETLGQLRARLQEAEAAIQMLESRQHALRAQVPELQEQLQRYQQAVTHLQIQAREQKGRMEILEAQIPEADRDEWLTQDAGQLADRAAQYRQQIQAVEQGYRLETEKAQQLREQRAQLIATREQWAIQAEAWQQQLQDSTQQLTQLLVAQQFEQVQEVQDLLALNDVEMQEEKGVVAQYYQNLHAATTQWQQQKEQNGAIQLDEAAYEAALQQKAQTEQAVQQAIEERILLENEVQQWQQKLQEKAAYEAEAAGLEARGQNLKTMSELFKANGFVEYISEMYLLNLCSVANERFHRLTRNQLSLIYDTDRGFEVMDYLNGGKTRSAKTLSGGQAFQASLCLALALADSIQSLNRFDKNFFFIDEGFGTLDKESIDIVFQTLEQLYREHRVVGIISHVEELQERISRYIQVVKDPERGSLVQTSG